ncbi:MAG: hypothetical protein IID40_08965, partial [Planctomycetes bacterium]|nr:hypothetical protein [Planctomycetota bacterium]
GDAATGYVVYESSNGLAFGAAGVLGNVLTTTFSGVPVGETHYYRVAATNTGGESMPTETVAVRRPDTGTATVLIVNGFDSLRRFQNPIHDIDIGAGTTGTFERPLWRLINSFDYVMEFAQALEPLNVGFASCVNEAVIDLQIALGDYDVALWNLGTELTEDATLTSGEQSKVTAFLDNGGGFFVSGAEIGYDLIDQLNGVSFMQNALATGYVSNDAGTSDVTAAGSGILSDVGAFDFDYANGAPYNVYSPDQLTPLTGAVGILNYVGGSGGTAGVQYDSGVFRTVIFGFPFEAITSATTRADIMQRLIAYLSGTAGPLPFDFDNDGDVDLSDYGAFNFCLQGPNATCTPGHFCLALDGNDDLDVDLDDFGMFQAAFTG